MADADRQIIVTPYGRLSFPSLAKPRQFKKDDDAKYGAAILFPKAEKVGDNRESGAPVSPWKDASKHDISHLQGVIDEFIENTYGKKVPAKLKRPFKDGDDEKWEGYEGHTFIRTTSARPPKLIDERKQEVTGEDIEKLFYPGCWVRAIVNPFAYNTAGNVGVSFGLQALQFVRHDEPFTGGINAQEAFDDLPDEDLAPSDLDDLE